MTKLIYSQNKSNEQNICFQVIARIFFTSTLSFRKFKWNFDFLFEILRIFWSHMSLSRWLKVQYVS